MPQLDLCRLSFLCFHKGFLYADKVGVVMCEWGMSSLFCHTQLAKAVHCFCWSCFTSPPVLHVV